MGSEGVSARARAAGGIATRLYSCSGRVPANSSGRHRPNAPCLGRAAAAPHASLVRCRNHLRNAEPGPPGGARRSCDIQNRGRPGSHRIAALGSYEGRCSASLPSLALSAALFVETTSRFGVGSSPGNLTSWWLAVQANVNGGWEDSFRRNLGFLPVVRTAVCSSAAQALSASVVSLALGYVDLWVPAFLQRCKIC